MKKMIKLSLITVSVLVCLAAWAEENNSNEHSQNHSSNSAVPAASASPGTAVTGTQEEQRPCGLAPGEPITNCPAVKSAEETEGDTAAKPSGNKNPEVKSNVLVTSVGQTAQKVSQPVAPVKEEDSSKKGSTEK
jgi:hypothetical protein